jgi:hypothetical protein
LGLLGLNLALMETQSLPATSLLLLRTALIAPVVPYL